MVVVLAARSKKSVMNPTTVEPQSYQRITLFKNNQADRRNKVKLHLSLKKLVMVVWLSVFYISCAHLCRISTLAHGSNRNKLPEVLDQTTDPSTLLKDSITSLMMMKSQSKSNLAGQWNFHKHLSNLNSQTLVMKVSQEPISAIGQLHRREDTKITKDKLTKMSCKGSSRHSPKMMMKL
jgi:hypothetical protein